MDFNKLISEDSDKRKHLIIGGGLVLGFIMCACGGVFTWMFAMSSVFTATATRDPNTGEVHNMGAGMNIPWSMLVVAMGLVIMVMSVVYGLVNAKGPAKGPRTLVKNAQVSARDAMDDTGAMHTEAGQMEFYDDLKYYVRLSAAGIGSVEYECVDEVFWMCGEGMKGDAEIQGRWLGAFMPYQTPHVPVV